MIRWYVKKVILLAICLSAVGSTVAQSAVGGIGARTIDNNKPNSLFTEIKAPEGEIFGDTYLNSAWLVGSVELVSGEVIKDKDIRYDIDLDQLEIRINGAVKGIQGRNMNWFSVNGPDGEEAFINGRGCTLNGTRVSGFLQQLSEGEWFLVRRTQIQLQEGSYVAAIDLGSKDAEYVKKSKLYIVTKSQLTEVVPNKKKFSEQFGENEEDILKFMKENDISLKNLTDLLSLVNYLNKSAF